MYRIRQCRGREVPANRALDAEVDRVIDERNYTKALRLYNKGLLAQIELLFGFAHKGMPELVKRLASTKKGATVLSALREELPELESPKG